MDTTSCPPLYATDLVLTPVATGTCNASILAWVFFMILFAIGNIWAAVERTTLHKKRKAGKRVVPWVVIFSWMSALVVLIFTFIPFLGADAANGGTLVMLVLVFFIFGSKCLLLLRKLVKLGRRIIPLAQKLGIDDASSTITSSTSGNVTGGHHLSLSAINNVLRVLFALGWILLVIQLVFLLVLDFAEPYNIDMWVTVTLALQASVVVLLCSCLEYQLQRCIDAMENTIRSLDALNGMAQSSKLMSTIRKMRAQQVIIAITAAPAVIFYVLCAASVIPRHHAAVLVIVGLDILTNILVLRGLTAKYEGARYGREDEPHAGVVPALPVDKENPLHVTDQETPN